jgi:WD40 repeat protein
MNRPIRGARAASLVVLAATLLVPLGLPAQTADGDGLPLTPTRTFSATLSEGTWMSVDVHPEGHTIVFDLLGDLYLLPMEGGTARPLMEGMPFYGQPRFSPDGDRVAFISDRDGGDNLWIVATDGSDTVQVTTGKNHRYQSPAWTPDGEYLVASRAGLRAGVGKLRLFHVEGGPGIQLIDEPNNLRTEGPAVTADGRYIWFAERARQLGLQRPAPPVSARGVRPGDGRALHPDGAVRVRLPPHPLSERPLAGLRIAPRRAHRAGDQGPGDGR